MYSLFTLDHMENLQRLDEIYFSLGKILKENERKYKSFLASEVTGNLTESFYFASTFFQYEPVLDKYSSVIVPVHTNEDKTLVLWSHPRFRGFGPEIINFMKEIGKEISSGHNYIVWKLNQMSADVSENL